MRPELRRAYIAYAVWLVVVLAAAAGALAWYRRVEEITWQALASRLNETPVTTSGDDDNEPG